MKHPITYLCILLLALASCGSGEHSHAARSAKSFEDIQDEVLDVFYDKSVSAERLADVLIQYGDYLKIAASNLDNVDMRVDTQRRSSFTVSLLLEKFAQMDSLGIEVSRAQMDSCLSSLIDVINQWYYSENEGEPMIFKEVYYNSYQQSENPVPGYFQIFVYLPTEKHTEPAVGIFYPQTAKSDPLIIFTKKEEDGVPAGGWDDQDFVYANSLEMKNAKGDGAPMNDFFGPDFLEKMLNNEHMYLMFYSESPEPGVLGDREIARLDLRHFQDVYNKVTK